MHAFTFFILFFTSIFLETQASNENCATMCTHGTPHIQFPFHVRGQQPDHGGDPIYELDCNNTTKTTTIHFPSYGDLVVKSISYDMKRLDLLDPKSCVHEVFLNLNLSLTPFQYYYVVREYSYLNCSVRLPPSFFSEIPCLSGSDYHVYTVPPFLAVPNSCRVVKTVPIPFGYSPYLSDNSFGLGLIWGSVGDGQEETESFTMAPVKAICIILIFAAVLLRNLKRLQHLIEGEDQVQVEKLSGDYKLLKVETCCNSDLKQGNSQGETVLDIKIMKQHKMQAISFTGRFTRDLFCKVVKSIPITAGGYRRFRFATMQFRIIEWDQGWNFIQEGIMNLKKRIAKGSPENQASSTEIVDMYTTVYNMCTQKPPYEYTEPLYDRYQRTFEEHITSTVLPSLKAKHDEFLLQEFVKSWGDYKVMLRWMSRSFAYLDRYFLDRRSLPGLKEAAVNYYRDLVYREVNAKVREAAIRLIDKEREGGEIDSALLKNAIDIFVEIGAGRRDAYEKDFEGYMLTNTRDYYSRKASRWILEDNYTNYMLKAEECLRRERDIVSHYLHPSSEKMLVETVKHWLLVVYANQLIGKKRSESGCGGDCLTVDNIEELSKKFIAAVVLEQQVPAQCSTLFQQAEDPAMQE